MFRYSQNEEAYINQFPKPLKPLNLDCPSVSAETLSVSAETPKRLNLERGLEHSGFETEAIGLLWQCRMRGRVLPSASAGFGFWV